jgi:hypothetical protein
MGIFVRTVEVKMDCGLLIRGYIPTAFGFAFGRKVKWTLTPVEGNWIIGDSTVKEETEITSDGLQATGQGESLTITRDHESWRDLDGEGSADVVQVLSHGILGGTTRTIRQDGTMTKPNVLTTALGDLDPHEVFPLE